jgi:hypothetical protein
MPLLNSDETLKISVCSRALGTIDIQWATKATFLYHNCTWNIQATPTCRIQTYLLPTYIYQWNNPTANQCRVGNKAVCALLPSASVCVQTLDKPHVLIWTIKKPTTRCIMARLVTMSLEWAAMGKSSSRRIGMSEFFTSRRMHVSKSGGSPSAAHAPAGDPARAIARQSWSERSGHWTRECGRTVATWRHTTGRLAFVV